MAETKYGALKRFIEYTEETLKVKVYVKDHVDFILLDEKLTRALGDNLAHLNPYCMYIKSDPERYIKCTGMMDGIIKKLTFSNEPYAGICHAGVKEYICPIICEGRLIGTVHAGDFAIENRYARRFIDTACAGTRLDPANARALYEANMQKEAPDIGRLKLHLEMIADTLGLIFARAAAYGEYSPMQQSTSLYHNDIITGSLEYLQQHFTENVAVADVAAYCHCSVSCLSHLFKARTGTGISVYLTKLRLDEARKQLAETTSSIGEIASNCGFSDPNYFTRVFTRVVGLTPRQMRKRMNK